VAPEQRRDLAESTETIDDWLRDMTRRETTGEEDMRQRLEEAREALRTEDLAADLRQAADDQQQGRPQLAEQTDRQAAERLRELADTLEREKRRLVQTRLERLAQAEAETRELQRNLEEQREQQQAQQDASEQQAQAEAPPQTAQQSGREAAAKRLRDLADDLADLDDDPLEELGNRLREQVGPQNIRGGPERGVMIPETVSTETLPPVARRLRELIDETVQREMLLNRDERIPDEYNRLVEKYFRALSDDVQGDGP
jgi:DNA repair exonuclease SbcCD ATPase subunit